MRWSIFLKIDRKKSFLVDVRLSSEYAPAVHRRTFRQLKLFVPNDFFDIVNVVLQHLVYRLAT